MHEFGGPEVLRLADLAEPDVGPDVVLVGARAAGVNPVDFKIRKGGLASRYPCNFPLIPGWDVAGVVEAVGPAVPERWVAATGSSVPTPMTSPRSHASWTRDA